MILAGMVRKTGCVLDVGLGMRKKQIGSHSVHSAISTSCALACRKNSNGDFGPQNEIGFDRYTIVLTVEGA
jgi:hypothetical protein